MLEKQSNSYVKIVAANDKLTIHDPQKSEDRTKEVIINENIPNKNLSKTEPATKNKSRIFLDEDIGYFSYHKYRRLQWYLDLAKISEPNSKERKRLSDIIVAVLDTGVAFENAQRNGKRYGLSHDLRKTKFVRGYDFINNDPYPNDDNQHGTFMTSVIAADGGIIGVAPGVKIMPVKVLGSNVIGTEEALISGIRYAVDHEANIINLSLNFPKDYEPNLLLRETINRGLSMGVVFVAAAGNDSGNYITYPANFPGIISVGATRLRKNNYNQDFKNVIAGGYSNFTNNLSILAPGGALDQDVNEDYHPDGILAMTLDFYNPNRFAYWFQSGTSPAAAIVSGCVARLLAAGSTPDIVYKDLISGSENYIDGIPFLNLAESLRNIKVRQALTNR